MPPRKPLGGDAVVRLPLPHDAASALTALGALARPGDVLVISGENLVLVRPVPSLLDPAGGAGSFAQPTVGTLMNGS